MANVPRTKGGNQPPNRRVRKSPKNSWTSPKRIKLAKRQAEALELREIGYSFVRIGQEMGISHQTAGEYVQVAMEKIVREPAIRVLIMELQRLDTLQAAFYHLAVEGDDKAAARVQAIMDQRARYLGLYAPTKTSIEGKDGGPVVVEERPATDHELARALASFIAKLRARGHNPPEEGGANGNGATSS